MEHIYYFLAIILLYNELEWLFAIDKQIKYYRISDKLKNSSMSELPESERKELGYIMMRLLFIWIWLFIGFFTSEWKLFVTYIPISIFLSGVATKYKYTNTWKTIHYINSAIGAAFCIFLIINKYHLHII